MEVVDTGCCSGYNSLYQPFILEKVMDTMLDVIIETFNINPDANFITQDWDGQVWWFTHLPRLRKSPSRSPYWGSDDSNDMGIIGTFDLSDDWSTKIYSRNEYFNDSLTKLNELLPDELFDSKDWKQSDIVGKVEWLLAMYDAKLEEIEWLQNQ